MKLTKSFLIKEYVKKRKPIMRIASETNYAHGTIHNYLIKYNIPRRSLSEAHMRLFAGEKNPIFGKFGNKNPKFIGRKINNEGYVYLYAPKHPYRDSHNYVAEHRLIMEKHLGRYLKLEEKVHHKGIKYPLGSIENKQDNHSKNLRLFVNESEHQKYHHKIRRQIWR